MSPEETVAAYFSCILDGRYRDAVDLVSAKVIHRFMEDDLPHLRPPPPPTVEGYLERTPDLPRAVAEFWVSNASRHRTTWADFLAGVESEEEIASIPDAELYARRLEAIDHAARHRRLLDILIARHPEYEDQLGEMRGRQRSTWQFETYGSLEYGGRAYVLFGDPLSDETPIRYEPQPHVAVLRRTEAGWRLAADPSPYSGMAVVMGQIEVTNEDGETVMLDPFQRD